MNFNTDEVIIPLDIKEIKAIRNNQFELHSMKMKLENIVDKSIFFSGPGMIRQELNGKLKFTLYAKEEFSSEEVLEEILNTNDTRIGKIIPERHFFKLSAIDGKGREWNSDRILPDCQIYIEGTLCKGILNEIVYITNIPVGINTYNNLHLEFYDDIKIPANSYTYIKKITGKNVSRSSERNALIFKTALHEYDFQKIDNRLQILLKSNEQPFVENFEIRLIEGLQFVFAQPIDWSLLIKWTIEKLEIRIKSTIKNSKRYRLFPPIVNAFQSSPYFCELFDKYMTYILANQTGIKIHPISAQIRSICHASMGSIQAQALTLAVAIESILKFLQPVNDKPSSEIKEGIKKAQNYFKTWGGPSILTDQIKGFLARLNDTNASKKFDELIKKGIITKQQKDAWNKLRHKLAHGSIDISGSLQEILDLSNMVLVMFYFLIFHIIGYQGKYTNYSSDGWPISDYPVLT